MKAMAERNEANLPTEEKKSYSENYEYEEEYYDEDWDE